MARPLFGALGKLRDGKALIGLIGDISAGCPQTLDRTLRGIVEQGFFAQLSSASLLQEFNPA